MEALQSAHLLAELLWTSDPTIQTAIGLMALAATAVLVGVHGSLWLRLIEAGRVEHALAEVCAQTAGSRSEAERRRRLNGIDAAFSGSFLDGTWHEFRRRREQVLAAAPEDRAPVRIGDLIDERPLIPHGVRRSLLPALPVMFFAAGVIGFIGALALASSGQPLPDHGAQNAHLLHSLGAGLQLALWGTLFSLGSLIGARILDGRAEKLAATIDALVASTFGVLSNAEFATRSAQAQRLGFDRLGVALSSVARDMRDSIEHGMKQIEESTAAAASLVTEDQRTSMRLVIEDLSQTLRDGVDQNLQSLRSTLQETMEQQNHVAGGFSSPAAFDHMEHDADAQARASHSLEEAAQVVERAAAGMNELFEQIQPALRQLEAAPPGTAAEQSATEPAQPVVAPEPAAPVESVAEASGVIAQDIEDDDAAAIRRLSDALKNGMDEFSDVVAREAAASRAAYAPLKLDTSDGGEAHADAAPEPLAAGRGYSALLSRYRHQQVEPAGSNHEMTSETSTSLAAPLLETDRLRYAASPQGAEATLETEPTIDPEEKEPELEIDPLDPEPTLEITPAVAESRPPSDRVAPVRRAESANARQPQAPDPFTDPEASRAERRKIRLHRFFGV